MTDKQPPFLVAPRLEAAGVPHGFFSRQGGVSSPPFATLNTGPGSSDDPASVRENRGRCAIALGTDPAHLLTLYQIHSANVVVVEGPWAASKTPPQADALITQTRGLALGALSADCMPFLFFEPDAQIIAATHAGWRGALAGVLEATISKMVALGAEPAKIIAAVGPCLRPPNFEVGDDLFEAFTAKHPEADRFFSARDERGKRQLDLTGFGAWRLAASGARQLDDLGICTLAESDAYFSYRASRQAGDADYGRNLSAIMLPLK